MFQIRGKYATASCYATQIDDGAVGQILAMCNQPFTAGCNVAVMPDAHAGAGCTIGTTMQVKGAAVPNVVGVDIGCGMYAVDLGDVDLNMERLDEACHGIPNGFGTWDQKLESFDLADLVCYARLKDVPRIARSLGTLGGGNHFIEVDASDDGRKHLVIHSGSRNLGTQVAKHYQDLAVDLHRLGASHDDARQKLIATYKAEGRADQIQAALEGLEAQRREGRCVAEGEPADHVPDELCWLSGPHLDDYLHDVRICQAFARRSRELMASVVMDRLGLPQREGFHTVHNYIDTDEMILRKGAIAAHEGELVLIPLNMRDGAVLARGRGNAEWNFSAPHGAGRLMSRSAAKRSLSMDEFRASMTGVYTTCVCEATLDESPAAYKSADDILGPIEESVDVVERIRPIYNFKSTDQAGWRKAR